MPRVGPDVVAVRQNLILLVDHGVAASSAGIPSDWGAVLGGGSYTWRSGVGVTVGGDLVYVGGPSLDPASLARLLIAAGAVRAMELDINPEWVSFATFVHAGGVAGKRRRRRPQPPGRHVLRARSLPSALLAGLLRRLRPLTAR